MKPAPVSLSVSTVSGERRRFTTRVKRQAMRIAENTYELLLQKPEHGFSFQAGQSIKFCFGDEKPRSFTIASAPEDETLAFVFRGSDSALKKNLLALREDDEVQLLDARGECVYPLEADVPVVMLAGGVGVALGMSLLRHAAHVSDMRPFVLLYANKIESSIAYREELSELSQKINLSVTYFLTRARAPGYTYGHISAAHIASHAENPLALFYAVGPKLMVDESLAVFDAVGIPEARRRSKVFKGYEGLLDA